MVQRKTQLVELVMGATSSKAWSPTEGPETTDLLAHFHTKSKGRFDATAQRNLLNSTTQILSKCVDPSGPANTTTGLVIGYVQSGKTMSFTTVAAMAADSGYPIVIVITGTTDILYKQSANRLDADIRRDSRTDRRWQHFREPGQNERDRLDRIIQAWRDPSIPTEHRRIALISVKKNWSVLENLNALLQSIDRSGMAAMIIDDEADQASLNGQARQSGVTPTYARLRDLRSLFRTHTFLQYTATPQGPLLISILDSLSPDFAVLLSPGEDYTGGIEFFGGQQQHIRRIPANATPTNQNPIQDPPDSLIEALQVFFAGVAAGYARGENNRDNRTMLIHPSRGTTLHSSYALWVSQLLAGWYEVLGLGENDPDRVELLSEFKRAYEDVAGTVGAGMPGWDEVSKTLRRAIGETSTNIVNRTPQGINDITWGDEYAWILVGGDKLNRGFTVEGLTVTYMPRGLGTGNADTIQQRARFFGYKRGYLGYCRIYMDADSIDAFTDYVTHEESYRVQLQGFSGKPLSEWKRGFLMAPGLRPTRRNILVDDYLQDVYSDRWYWVQCPHKTDNAIEVNRQLFDACRSQYQFAPLPDQLFGPASAIHEGAIGIPLREVYEQFLVPSKVPDVDDSQAYYGVMLQIQEYMETHPNEVCDIYAMRPAEVTRRAISSDTEQIDYIFQGANKPKTDPMHYPGDLRIHGDGRLTIQLRRLTLTGGGRELNDVPVLAIWVPSKMGATWVVQDPPVNGPAR